MAEIWKDIQEYEGYYQISNHGNIRSLDRIVIDKNGRRMNYKGRKLTPQLNEFGYEKIVLVKNRLYKNYKIHQLVAIAFIENPFNFQCINHKDGNKSNNKAENLEWCTYSENIKHAYDTGLKKPYERHGSKNSKAKFTDEEVISIREQHKANGGEYGTMYLARQYRVNKDTITNLISYKTYSKVGES